MIAIDWLKLFSPRNIAAAVLLAVVVFCGFKTYNWIYDRGHDSRDKEVAKLTAERDEAKTDLKEYKEEYEKWVEGTAEAKRQAEEEYANNLAEIQKKLDDANKRKNEREVVIHEVVKYVTPEVDQRYALPRGFVWMFSQTLQGEAATRAALGELSVGDGGDVGSPSGFAMSDFATHLGQNNLECVQRGVVIQQWQSWYIKNKAAFEKASKQQADNAPPTQ